MQDKLGELEARISKLVDLLSQKVERIAAVERENAELAGKLKEAEEQIATAEAERSGLERQLQENAGKEDEMRGRLMGLIERIDRVESELGQSANGGQTE